MLLIPKVIILSEQTFFFSAKYWLGAKRVNQCIRRHFIIPIRDGILHFLSRLGS